MASPNLHRALSQPYCHLPVESYSQVNDNIFINATQIGSSIKVYCFPKALTSSLKTRFTTSQNMATLDNQSGKPSASASGGGSVEDTPDKIPVEDTSSTPVDEEAAPAGTLVSAPGNGSSGGPPGVPPGGPPPSSGGERLVARRQKKQRKKGGHTGGYWDDIENALLME